MIWLSTPYKKQSSRNTNLNSHRHDSNSNSNNNNNLLISNRLYTQHKKSKSNQHDQELTQKNSLQYTNPEYNSRNKKPKHLQGKVSQRAKKQSLTKIVWKQPIIQKIKRQKQKQLKPLKDIQTIMKHLDYKLGKIQQNEEISYENIKEDYISPSILSLPKSRFRKQRQIDKDACQVQKRIKTILSLPTIKKIKTQANQIKKKYQFTQKPGVILFKQLKKKQILQDYNNYIMGQARRKQSNKSNRFITQY